MRTKPKIGRPKKIGDEKKCTDCKLVLPRDQFYKDKKKSLGLACRCKKCDVARREIYRKKHLKFYAEYRKIYATRYPEKIVAQTKLNYQVRLGNITKTLCEVCAEKKVEGHHEDYSKPLVVNWLCKRCHVIRHKQLKTYA